MCKGLSFLYNVCEGKRSVYEGRLSLLPFVPFVDAFPPVVAFLPVVAFFLVKALPVAAFLLVVAIPPLAALSVEGFPPVAVSPVAVVIRLREVVVLFVEDEA